jgi:hypothetical protein
LVEVVSIGVACGEGGFPARSASGHTGRFLEELAVIARWTGHLSVIRYAFEEDLEPR